jgi:hypothetical protein
VKVAALWVKMLVPIKNNEAWCSFFMEPTVEKRFGEVVRSGIYTTEKPFMFLLSVKI